MPDEDKDVVSATTTARPARSTIGTAWLAVQSPADPNTIRCLAASPAESDCEMMLAVTASVAEVAVSSVIVG